MKQNTVRKSLLNDIKVKTHWLHKIGKDNSAWINWSRGLNEYDSNEIDDNEMVNVRTSR